MGGRGTARPWVLCVAHSGAAVEPITLGAVKIRVGREAEAGVDLVLPDPTVSRVHAALTPFPGEETLLLEDCGSSNGVFLNGHRIEQASARAGDVVRLGDSLLVVVRVAPAPPDDAEGLGLVGRSPLLAALRAMVRKVAPSALPVLIGGETGTGKELVAAAVHAASGRRGAFVPVNCAALPATLVENILFGHRKGAFTGATSIRTAPSRAPTAARCSSTRWASWPSRRSPSCCACSRTAR